MSKLILIDQLHIDLLVARSRASRKVDRAARVVRTKKFLNGVRKVIRAEVRKHSALKDVVARVTR